MNRLDKIAKDAAKNNEEVLIHIFGLGHGGIPDCPGSKTSIYLKEKIKSRSLNQNPYPLEDHLTNKFCKRNPYAFVVAYYDCCIADIREPRQGPSSSAHTNAPLQPSEPLRLPGELHEDSEA
jgi:hypothetical protein